MTGKVVYMDISGNVLHTEKCDRRRLPAELICELGAATPEGTWIIEFDTRKRHYVYEKSEWVTSDANGNGERHFRWEQKSESKAE